MTEPVRVLLADDEHLIRGALATLLGLEDDLQVVAQAASGPEALAMARALRRGANEILTNHPNIGRKGRVTGTREFVIARTPFIMV